MKKETTIQQLINSTKAFSKVDAPVDRTPEQEAAMNALIRYWLPRSKNLKINNMPASGFSKDELLASVAMLWANRRSEQMLYKVSPFVQYLNISLIILATTLILLKEFI